MITQIKKDMQDLANAVDAQQLARYFKTGTGGYAENDKFRGIRMPAIRKLVSKWKHISLEDAVKLLTSDYHEDRMLALLILINKYQKGDDALHAQIFEEYLNHRKYINNWDLIDLSAEHIVGAYLWNKPRDIILKLSESDRMWDRRIAVMATFHFIKRNDFDDMLKLAAMLLGDKEDLIHKATGWMLREIGKRDVKALRFFLKHYAGVMPRTMLRYAIEKFESEERQIYMNQKPRPVFI